MKIKIENYIKTWESRCYKDGIPDELPNTLESLDRIPSYKKICMAIMKNEFNLESLGITRKPCAIYQDIKREEIRNRNIANNKTETIQLNLFRK